MIKRLLRSCLLVAGLLLAPTVVLAQGNGAAAAAPTLQPGDHIRIVVWRQPEFSGEFAVAPDGSITHPLYQQVQVAGLPIGEVEERVRVFLERYEATPQFALEALLRVAVAGEVRQPSLYNFPAGTTVAQALVAAGGPTERGRLDEVRVLRDGAVIQGDLTDPASPLVRMPVHSGDQVVVGRRRSVFREVVWPIVTVSGAVASWVSVFSLLF